MFNSKPPAGSPAARTVLQQAANPVQPDPVPSPAANDTVEVGNPPIKLSQSITTHAGPVRELTLRQPTFTDYIAIGDIDTPVLSNFDDNGRPTMMEAKTNHDAMMRWAVALTGLDKIVLSHLTPADAGQLMRRVRLAVAPFQKGNL